MQSTARAPANPCSDLVCYWADCSFFGTAGLQLPQLPAAEEAGAGTEERSHTELRTDWKTRDRQKMEEKFRHFPDRLQGTQAYTFRHDPAPALVLPSSPVSVY